MADGRDLEAFLSAQDLTPADLEANRAGQVSERQVAQVDARRRTLTLIPVTSIATLLLVSTGLSVFGYLRDHHPAIFVVPAIAVFFSIFFYAFFALFLRLPRIEGRKVVAVQGPVAGFLAVSAGGGYVIRIDGVRYKGVANGLPSDLVGKTMLAYVVPDVTMIVALVPA